MDRETAKIQAKKLVSEMTLEEKASQLLYGSPEIKRLRIKSYNWWNESLHGVARAGTATVFPQCIGMAATFDKELVHSVGDAVATEARAKYNAFQSLGDHNIYKGLTFWSPNVNIFRDPRWGRGHETYGEDPFLSATLGSEYVRGLQGNGKYYKVTACAKHFAVHSGPESMRHSFNAEVSKKDLFETYLPAFEILVRDAKVEGVMGAYNRTNGEPCCGSKTLMVDILRKEWGFDGYYVSDCGAINDFKNGHHVTDTDTESCALAIKNGCELNCGSVYGKLLCACEEGLITEGDITKAAEVLMTTRIMLGEFDDSCEFNNISYDRVDCDEHKALNLKAAKESLVLLKNNGILPVDKSKVKTVAVIGPNAQSTIALEGNYCGTASEYITVVDGMRCVFDSSRILFAVGSHICNDRTEGLAEKNDRISEAVFVAKNADLTVLCVGLDQKLEGEEGDTYNASFSGDKKDLLLPECQRDLMHAVLENSKNVIVVNLAGSAIDLSEANEKADAVITAWYPGARGGLAVAELLCGKFSPSGKLPVTFYKNDSGLPDFTDYAVAGKRTYRYSDATPLYPFGYGLSYTSFEYSDISCDKQTVTKNEDVTVSFTVKNTGDLAGCEISQLYISARTEGLLLPKYQLCGFARTELLPGESKRVSLTIPSYWIATVDNDGVRAVRDGSAVIYAGGSQPDSRSTELTHTSPISVSINTAK